jgi:hypothetical protein
MKPLLWPALLLVTGLSAPAYCQSDPFGAPPGEPVYEQRVFYAPVQVLTWSPANNRWIRSWQRPTTPAPTEVVMQIITTKPRHREHSPSSPIVGDGGEFNGAIWALGRSQRRNNPPPYRGYFESDGRTDCVKAFVAPNGGASPTFLRERYEGEPYLTTRGFAPGQQPPYSAHSIFIKFSGPQGRAVGIRHDRDHGTPCAPAYGGAGACLNPDCSRYGICAAPCVYPNDPCGTCGQPGYDPTRTDWFVGRWSTSNMQDWWGHRWDALGVPDDGRVLNAGTVAQARTATGTPPMAAALMQTIAYSDAPLVTQHGVVPDYAHGWYVEVIDDLRIRWSSVHNLMIADYRLRTWRLWGARGDSAALFAFLGDWFNCRWWSDCDRDGCAGVADITAFLCDWMAP